MNKKAIIFTRVSTNAQHLEEQEKIGIGKRIDGPSDWKPDPNAAERFHEFIENGGNADPALDAIQDGDYHDLLDQNGGPEGF